MSGRNARDGPLGRAGKDKVHRAGTWRTTAPRSRTTVGTCDKCAEGEHRRGSQHCALWRHRARGPSDPPPPSTRSPSTTTTPSRPLSPSFALAPPAAVDPFAEHPESASESQSESLLPGQIRTRPVRNSLQSAGQYKYFPPPILSLCPPDNALSVPNLLYLALSRPLCCQPCLRTTPSHASSPTTPSGPKTSPPKTPTSSPPSPLPSPPR